MRLHCPLLFAVLLAACMAPETSKTKDGARDSVISDSTAPATDAEGAKPTSTGNQPGGSFSNLVNSDARVVVNLGPFKDLKSGEPLKHIYLRGTPGVSPDRVYLSGSLLDEAAGLRLRFQFDYLDESDPIDLMKHGYLSMQNAGTQSLATAGTITVSHEAPNQVKLLFTSFELGEVSTSNPGSVGASKPMEDGSVVGDVERVCLGPGGGSQDTDNPFCAAP